ncbi:MAG: ribosome biogenesis GTPase Der [Alphaproteobacteria bacterium]
MTARIAIVGRPNVGKSTLFNRLVGRRLALVDDTPGVTRDWREGDARLGDLRFAVMDTAGLEDSDDATLSGRMRDQTLRALAQCDAALFVFDARDGLTELDRHFAALLRTQGQRVILVANKCESRSAAAGAYEGFDLGLGEPVAISAEHGAGMADLYEALRPIVEAAGGDAEAEAEPAEGADEREGAAEADAVRDAQAEAGDEEPAAEEEDDPTKPLRLAVVGRPNVGKSTLINRLVGEDRLLTGPEAGITRDSIRVAYAWRERPVQLIDTAGLRRKANVTGKLERLSVADTLTAVRFAEVVAVVIDATQALERQDLAIIRLIANEGRALVLVLNKWDLVEDRSAVGKEVTLRLGEILPEVRGAPLVRLSAQTGEGVAKLMPAVIEAYGLWNKRIATGQLNRWLTGVVERHPPPAPKGRRLQLRYMTQIKTRPPTFALFVNRPAELPESYKRYLTNDLRQVFGLEGTPIRLLPRRGKNPYVKQA